MTSSTRLGRSRCSRCCIVTSGIFDSIYGHLGVRLFFVISGFLITGILLRSRSIIEAGAATTGLAIGHFLARTGASYFPAYYLLMLALAAVNAQNIRSVLPWHLLYASNICRIRDDYDPLGSHPSLVAERRGAILLALAAGDPTIAPHSARSGDCRHLRDRSALPRARRIDGCGRNHRPHLDPRVAGRPRCGRIARMVPCRARAVPVVARRRGVAFRTSSISHLAERLHRVLCLT